VFGGRNIATACQETQGKANPVGKSSNIRRSLAIMSSMRASAQTTHSFVHTLMNDQRKLSTMLPSIVDIAYQILTFDVSMNIP
jgi:hypothetical protein